MLKRILGCLTAVTMLVGVSPAVINAADEKPDNSGYAEYTFAKSRIKTNITKVFMSNEQTIEKDGKQALVRSPQALYMYLTLDSKEFANPDGQPVKISVEYYDEGKGCFTLAYDGTDNVAYPTHSHTNAKDIVYMTDDRHWKVHDFYLDDITFMHNYVDGYDFRVALWADEMGMSADNIYIHSVKVQKLPISKIYKMSFSSAMTGNIFGPGEDKLVDISLRSLCDFAAASAAEYIVKDFDGNEVLNGSFDFETEPRAVYNYTIDLNPVDTFGVYTIYVTVKSKGVYNGEETEFVCENTADFSYVNKPELKNPVMNTCTHAIRWGSEATAEIADYGGFGAVRDEIAWNDVEKKEKVFAIPEQSAVYTSEIEKNGTGYMLILDYGNVMYDTTASKAVNVVPHTEKGLEGFRRYCRYMAEKYKGFIKYYEVWNEYNLSNFNVTMEGAETYVKLCKIAYEEVKAVDPNAEIVGMGVAGTEPNFMRSVFEHGGYQYMDAVSCHPYDWSGDFRNEYFIERLHEISDLLQEQAGEGNPRKPIYLTECGMNDSTAATGVSSVEQAADVIQMYALMTGEGVADKLWWYCLVNKGVDKKDQESNWGFVKNNAAVNGETPFAAKPSFAVLTGMNEFLTNAEPVGKIVDKDAEIRAYNYKTRKDDNAATLWTTGGSAILNISLGCSEITIYDMYTNEIGRLSSKDGIYSIGITNEPVYIRGNFSRFEEAGQDAVFTQSVHNANIATHESIDITFTDKEGRSGDIAVDVPEGITVEENTGLDRGIGRVRLVSDETIGSRRAVFTVTSGSALIGIYSSDIAVNEPCETEIADFEQISAEDDTHWRAVVKIRNKSISHTYDGICSAADGSAKPVKFFNLGPGEEQTIYMNLPELVKKRVINVSYDLTLSDGSVYTASRNTDFTSAKYAYEKPVIDGKITPGEWNGVWLCADEEENIILLMQTTWGGPEDLSYDCSMMWDEDKLYMAVKVRDSMFCNSEQPATQYKGDGIQFGIEDRVYQGDAAIDAYGTNSTFTEVAIAKLDGGPNMYRFRCIDDGIKTGTVEADRYDMAVVRDGDYTIYEMAIPWTEMFGPNYVLDSEKILGFSMLVNDNDGQGRRGFAQYNDGIGMGKNAMLFGKLTLLK